MSRDDIIYSATYSNVPVYEFNIDGNHVMRRRSDDWINATHILKVADYDKPARTRILEREVQKGVHEKVQGGYGKYQGTWIPLLDGRDLAAKNGVLDRLLPIFDYVPGEKSPPPAPKHATAASKPRAARAAVQQRKPNTTHHRVARDRTNQRVEYGQAPDYDQMDLSMREGEIPDNETVMSESVFDDFDGSQYTTSRKRRRIEDPMSQADKEHQLWADELLDYFMLQENTMDSAPVAPAPPATADLDRPIDDQGYTALHWAAAMGDIEVVKDLIRRGAKIEVQAKDGWTPIMRAVKFTNNHDQRAMEKLAGYLIRTVNMQDWSGNNAFHVIAHTTERKSKYNCARYYIDCILNKMAETFSPDVIENVINQKDQNGDTAILIAARHGARKCVRSLIGRHAAVDIQNNNGETADQYIVALNHRRQERNHTRQPSSSPFLADNVIGMGGAVQPFVNGNMPLDHPMHSSSLNGSMSGIDGNVDIYRSEAALAFITALGPTVILKCKNLASTIEAEIAEKNAEMREAERVVAIRRAEIEALRRQAEELRVQELEQTSGGIESDKQLSEDLEQLMNECEELTEQEQQLELKKLLDREQVKGDVSPDDMILNEDDTMRQKLALVRELKDLMVQRKALVKTVVQNLSIAGVDDKQAEYKRLIVGALRVREEDVQGMLPEILAELEDWHGMETIGA